MGGGSVLSIRVGGEQSGGLVTVIEGWWNAAAHRCTSTRPRTRSSSSWTANSRTRSVIGVTWRRAACCGSLARVPHAVANLSAHACRFLTIVTPAGIEAFFRAQRDYLDLLPPGIAPDPHDGQPARSRCAHIGGPATELNPAAAELPRTVLLPDPSGLWGRSGEPTTRLRSTTREQAIRIARCDDRRPAQSRVRDASTRRSAGTVHWICVHRPDERWPTNDSVVLGQAIRHVMASLSPHSVFPSMHMSVNVAPVRSR
jgi:hypothetical protein